VRLAAVVALIVALGVAPRVAEAQDVRRSPSAGYVYPAGGRRGTVVHATVGGQFLGGAKTAFVSGEGVRVSVVRALRPLDAEQRQELGRRIAEVRAGRQPGAARRAARRAARSADADDPPVELPDYRVLRDLDRTSEKGLDEIAARFLGFGGKRQMNAQLSDVVEIDVEIDARAEPGEREIRLATSLGLTNPLRFEVGDLPETTEQDTAQWRHEPTDVFSAPAAIDGQIVPGDVDRFRFKASRGQRLVIAARARNLTPFLADAVPGWFQAVMSLADARGREVAYADDFRFDPDPVLFYEVPVEGEYVLTIRDALFRGREDFVYRVTIDESPFITRMFPLGGREGAAVRAAVAGWNLLRDEVVLDTAPGGDAVRWAAAPREGRAGNRVPYRVDSLPEVEAVGAGAAQQVALPVVVNGRVERPGDVHVFRFAGRAGDEVVAEVEARRLSSPLDSVLRIVDSSGNVIAWNDDFDDGAPGVLTHHADSRVSARLPADGGYEVRLADAQRHGGPEFAYRLRIGPPRPDFELVVTPSSLNVPCGRAVPVRVVALRKDGFDGEIAVSLENPGAGFVLHGARVPAGRRSVLMTITAPPDPPDGPVVLRFTGGAQIDGRDVRRVAVGAEERMQAFAYRHLVPSQELMAMVLGPRRAGPPVAVAGGAALRVPVGGTARVVVSAPGLPLASNLRLILDDAAEGVVLEGWIGVPGGLELALGALPGAKAGTASNAVVELLAEIPAPRGEGGAPARRRTYSLGFVPAIPYEVVAR
jgi:hypothetical protein